MIEEWINEFEPLTRIEGGARDLMLKKSRCIVLPSDAVVFDVGQTCSQYILIRSGSVRVHLLDKAGHMIVLYRLGPGDTCILTTAALFADESYSATATTETEVEAVALPAKTFYDLLVLSDVFRKFVFVQHGHRIADLMSVVKQVAFDSIDRRLVEKLLQLASTDNCVARTHDELATELGTAREVISRRLKAFEQRGWIRIRKGHVEIIERAAMSKRLPAKLRRG